mmetsp:Transcript_2938/g.11904  ORF Transcript_2938/g.11904 Transcript_2938/m.11904 type:complete len:249 (-) Transcript_2938:3729-4475(-)
MKFTESCMLMTSQRPSDAIRRNSGVFASSLGTESMNSAISCGFDMSVSVSHSSRTMLSASPSPSIRGRAPLESLEAASSSATAGALSLNFFRWKSPNARVTASCEKSRPFTKEPPFASTRSFSLRFAWLCASFLCIAWPPQQRTARQSPTEPIDSSSFLLSSPPDRLMIATIPHAPGHELVAILSIDCPLAASSFIRRCSAARMKESIVKNPFAIASQRSPENAEVLLMTSCRLSLRTSATRTPLWPS